MTTQGTMGTWHRTRAGKEWRIDSDWAEDAPEGWVVTRLANRTRCRHEWDWTDYTEMTLETADGDAVDVIVDEASNVWTMDGGSLSRYLYGQEGVDAIEDAATSFRVEVGR